MTAFQQGLRAAVPTVFGYASIGLACGILAAQSGISPTEMWLMSLLVYSGSAQFAICGLVLAGTDVLSGVLTIFLMNLRNLLLNLHAATIFGRTASFGQQLLMASFMTDESYALMLTHDLETGQVEPAWMYGNNLASQASWVVFTVLGTVLGELLPDPTRLGIDFALIAMFVAIFAGQLEALAKRVARQRLVLMLGAVAGAYGLGTVFLPSSLAVLLATLVGCFVGVMTDD